MPITTHELTVSPREAVGTAAVKRLRRAGQLPVVAYGRGAEPLNLSIDAHTFKMLVARQNAGGLLMLKFADGKSEDIPVIVKEIQIDPRRNETRTVDFLRVSLSEKVSSVVPILLEGEPAGVRLEGGLLVQALHEIRIKALPQNLPEHILVDVTNLEMNGVIEIKDIELPEGIESEDIPEDVIASVAPPRVEAEPEEAPAAEGEEAPAPAEGEEKAAE